MTKGEFLLRDISLAPHIRDLIDNELISEVQVKEDKSVRIKITDRCGLTCVFCHNEGTPVTNPNNQTKFRVSIYERNNGCSFESGSIKPNSNFINSILLLKEQFGINEIHWTGGEPMLNKEVVNLTRIAKGLGFTVNMTSNGELGSKLIPSLVDAGIDSINYSIFGITPKEFLTTQSHLKQDINFANQKVSKVIEAIESSINKNIDVKANIVVVNEFDYQRVIHLINIFGKNLKIRLLPDLSKGNTSILAIYELLSKLKAQAISRQYIGGSSNYRSDFLTSDGIQIGFKQINRITLPITCANCKLNNEAECSEGYYGLRLYVDYFGNYLVGVCIQRMDLTMPISDFFSNNISNEVKSFKSQQYEFLKTKIKQK